MKDVIEKIKKTATFLQQDVWTIRRSELPRRKSVFLKALRVILFSIKGYREDKCPLHASALTFYTLVSIVPVVALAFGIAKGFGLEKVLEEQLRQKLAGHEAILANLLKFSHSLLENTKGGLIAGVGLIVLLWTAIKVLRQIELSFNNIWKIQQKRTVGRMLSDYLFLMFVCPIILILSGGMTVFIHTHLYLIVGKLPWSRHFSASIVFLLQFAPYVLMGSLFTFIYIFMPNTKVRFSSGLSAGLVTGTLFQVIQWLYISFQVGVARYNAIYGSFAALPLFMAWLQFSWTLMLFGAELSYAFQHADTYEREDEMFQASQYLRTLLALRITCQVVRNFSKGENPVTLSEISTSLDIPIRFVGKIIEELIKGHILSAVDRGQKKEWGYQPARDINLLTIHDVMNAMNRCGVNTPPPRHDPALQSLSASLEAFDRTIKTHPENKLLKDF